MEEKAALAALRLKLASLTTAELWHPPNTCKQLHRISTLPQGRAHSDSYRVRQKQYHSIIMSEQR
jgi:hypothetical protein